jgi:endonuclease/exonuclease/phosphatase family metal-dependent hydrolase
MSARTIVAIGLLAACDQAIGEAGPWVPWDRVAGAELVQPPGAPAAVDALRVITWNVEYGEGVEGLAAAVAGDPALAGAAVILVQEIESHPSEGTSRPQRLAEALGMGWAYAPAREEGDGTHGLAILSALPLENVMVKELAHVDLPVADYPRIALAADVVVGGAPLRLVDVHLDTRMSVSDRLVQLRPAVIDAPAAAVVGGDFNMMPYVWAGGAIPLAPVDQTADTDQAPIIDAFMRALDFATPTAELGATQHSLLLGELRLDALYPRGIRAGASGIERDIDLSDHWPVWVDLSVQAE